MVIRAGFIAILLLPLALAVQPLLASAGYAESSDSFCLQFNLERLLGNRSPTYTWSRGQAIPGKKSALPPSEHPEIVSRIDIEGYPGSALDEAKARPVTAPSAEDFQRLYPHDLGDLSKGQTSIKLYGSDYLVKAYNPETKEVLLEREELSVLQGSPRIICNSIDDKSLTIDSLMRSSSPTIRRFGMEYFVDKENSTKTYLTVFRWRGGYGDRSKEFERIPIQLTNDLYYDGFDIAESQLKPGQIIKNRDGDSYEVRSSGDHDQGKLLLRRIRQVAMRWDQFSALTQKPDLLRVLAAQGDRTAPTSSGFFSRVLARVGGSPRQVPLVGKNGMTLLDQKSTLLNDLSATRQEADPRSILNDLRNGRYPNGTQIQIKSDGNVKTYTIGKDGSSPLYALQDLFSSNHGVPQLYRLEQIQIIKPGENPWVIEKRYVDTPSGDRALRFYDASPVEGVDLRYQVNGPDHPAIVHVRFAKPSNPISQQLMIRTANQLVASLPLAHSDAQELILLENGRYYLGSAAGLASQGEISGQAVRSISMLKPALSAPFQARVQTFWHETGHSIAEKLWNNKFLPGIEWNRAVAMDAKFVSGYAITNFKEDFAETVEAYIASDGGRLQPELREKLGSRFALLDKVFALPEAKADALEVAVHASTDTGIELSPVTAESGTGIEILDHAGTP